MCKFLALLYQVLVTYKKVKNDSPSDLNKDLYNGKVWLGCIKHLLT